MPSTITRRALAGTLLAAPAPARAQTAWPRRPINLMIPAAPGGATDLMGRVMAQAMGPVLGGTVVAENRSGAAGVVGTEQLAQAAPDGYSIGIGMIGTIAVNPHVYPRLRYDTMRDFAPIGLVAKVPMVLLAKPELAAGGLRGFMDRVREAPDTITYGSAGAGSNVHIGMVSFLDAAGLKMVHVPYRGSGPMALDLVAGNIDSGMTGPPAALPALRDGRVVAIGVTSRQRLTQLPDVPAIAEVIPGFEALQWYGLMAPIRTPPEILARLQAAAAQALREPEVLARLTDEGAIPEPMTPQAFWGFVQEEWTRWGAMVRRTGLRPEN
jgi:tripartite-type tricarboxylate transporter receptor subunit TctC